jgi:ATP/maltotriose-dependent transcriptional regulator MalT
LRVERAFEKLRIRYEGLVDNKGYWFDHREASAHYSDPESSATLKECNDTLEELRRKVEGKHQAWSNVYVQIYLLRAYVTATMKLYDKALASVMRCEQVMMLIGRQLGEDAHYIWCRLYLLEGELAFVDGNARAAGNYFRNCQTVIERHNVTDFSDMCSARLALLP